MERKIGEIFEYNGEWYQCVIGCHCNDCAFHEKGCKAKYADVGGCDTSREDRTQVIFKKLEKVGEPCEFQKRTIQTYKLYTEPFISFDMDFICTYLEGSNTIDIIIKQNKEDMEEQNLTYEELLHYYHSTVGLWAIDRSPQEVSLDWICDNAFQLGIDEKDSNSENIGKNPREFDLEAAKAGKPVCTRDGRKARIICFDKEGEQPIVALIKNNEEESIDTFFSNGHSISKTNEVAGDLMMLPEKKEGWVNVMEGNNGKSYVGNDIYTTEDKAKEGALRFTSKLIDTIKISWEE